MVSGYSYMIEILTGFIITLISLIVGYSLGHGNFNKNQATTILNNIKEGFTQAKQQNKLGAFEEPTAQQLIENANPELKAELDAMREVVKDAQPSA